MRSVPYFEWLFGTRHPLFDLTTSSPDFAWWPLDESTGELTDPLAPDRQTAPAGDVAAETADAVRNAEPDAVGARP